MGSSVIERGVQRQATASQNGEKGHGKSRAKIVGEEQVLREVNAEVQEYLTACEAKVGEKRGNDVY